VSDRSYLQWPFFEERHRELAEKLRGSLAGAQSIETADEDGATIAWVKRHAENGWLAHAVASDDSPIDVRSLCLLREHFAYADAIADFAFAMQGLGSGAVSLFGSNELRAGYLSAVASGSKIAAFALSEREAGSDVSALRTRATRDGDDYVIDGEKTWISNGGIADFYLTFARTADDGAKGLSAFLIDAETPGLHITERIETISPHPLATIRFDGCRVPASRRLGHEGQGFKIAMATLDVFRPTVGAAALGFARRALDEVSAHVKERRLFGAPLAALQMTQQKIADMAVAVDAAALLVYRSAWTKDAGAARVTREAAMAKLFATESAFRVIDDAVQLFGGRGVRKGEIVERLYRDIRALRIYEGASEIQQVVIARSVLESP